MKARHQFCRRHRRSADLSDYHCAGVVSDIRGFERGRIAAESQSKESDGRIAGARNIEHLARFGRNVVRLFPSLEQHHALFSQGDQE